MISAAIFSWELSTGENTPHMETDLTPSAVICFAISRNSFSSIEEISRPSYSWPPLAIYVFPPIEFFKSLGQSTRGGSIVVAGKQSLKAAEGANSRRCKSALTKWVVPNITASICPTSGLELIRVFRQEIMPDVTSGVVGFLILLTNTSPSIKTASVFVPPTSIPIYINFCYLPSEII